MDIIYSERQKGIKNKAEKSATAFKALNADELPAETYGDEISNYYFNLIQSAAISGKPWAMYTLAYMYENGISVAKDLSKAFKWYENGAKLKDDNCQLELFYFYKYGKAGDVNNHLAIFWLKQSAEAGNPVAQYNLAKAYLEGTEEAYDAKKAVVWLKSSATCGFRDAMFFLGEIFEKGEICKVNYKEAYKWYLKASKLNYQEAQIKLAKLVFDKFSDSERHVKKAVAILKKLIKNGNDEALYLLGAYYKKLGHEYYEQAFILLNEAANTYGNRAAFYEIGEMYEMGLGLPKDNVKAMEYFNKVMNLL